MYHTVCFCASLVIQGLKMTKSNIEPFPCLTYRINAFAYPKSFSNVLSLKIKKIAKQTLKFFTTSSQIDYISPTPIKSLYLNQICGKESYMES